MEQLFKILTVFWFWAAIASAIATGYFLVQKDTDSALFFLFAFVISVIQFLLRRYQRKKRDQYLASQQQNQRKQK